MKKYFSLLALAGFACMWVALKVWGSALTLYYIKPSAAFDSTQAGRAPDYLDPRYWAALPSKHSAAMLRPAGDNVRHTPATADVFFIHPTSYISGNSWNAPMFTDTRAWEMVDIMLGAQASAFNACCDIYAPHYRQATLSSFLDREGTNGEPALDLAYSDIARAFDVFLQRNKGRPFIVASHSQGTYHALRLLSERIDGTALEQRMVAAYLIGYWVPLDTFGRTLKSITPCESAYDTGCVVHWSTYGEDGVRRDGIPHWYPSGWELSDGKELLCTNPLSWRRNGTKVEASEHPGALYVSRGGTRLNTLFNVPADIKLNALPAILKSWTWAECREGLLRIAPQDEGAFADVDPQQDYHMIDYSLFYQSVRENAPERVRSHSDLQLSSR